MEDSASTSQVVQARSCAACRRRKIKCDRGQPCKYCTRLRIQCVYPGPGHETRAQAGGDIASRLERIEASLQRLESRVTSPERSQWPGSVTASNTPDALLPEPRESTADQVHGKFVHTGGESRFVTRNFWTELDDDEDRDGALNRHCPLPDSGSVDSNKTGNLNPRNGFHFGFGSVAVELRQLHPTEDRIFTLWQVFLESVDPVLKLIHIPVTQRQILRAVQNLDDIPTAFESLMFAIYHAAVTSMEYSVSSRTLPQEERKALLGRYALGVEQALAKANFMSSPDLITLQALTLYLSCARQSTDKTYIWSMTGLLIRLARKLGLHEDPARLRLSLFDSEMRRRLWWQICILDTQTAEDNDLEPSIYEHTFTTKRPANVNDADLDVNMTHPISETPRRTEMLFTLARIEISYATRRLVFSPKFCHDNGYPSLSLQQKDTLLESISVALEEKFLKYCDGTIPICSLAATSTKAFLAKTKLTISQPFLCGSDLPQAHVTDLVTSSIDIIEYASTLRTDAKYSKWVWQFHKELELDAVAFLLHSMSMFPLSTLSHRAWMAVDTFWTRQDYVQVGEPRWQSLQHLRKKALARKGLETLGLSNDG